MKIGMNRRDFITGALSKAWIKENGERAWGV